MSRLGINTGSNPNDGQGDPLRVAMGKINSNFQEIYNTLGDGFTLTSYASTAGISTLARNLTGSPRINVSGVLNTGITTTEHLEVRNITSTGVVTATQFVGDGSQLTNVTALVGGLEVLDDNVRKGVARELNFGANIVSTGPDGVGRVTISVASSVLVTGIVTNAAYATVAGVSGVATVAQGLTGTPNLNVGVVTASRIGLTSFSSITSSEFGDLNINAVTYDPEYLPEVTWTFSRGGNLNVPLGINFDFVNTGSVGVIAGQSDHIFIAVGTGKSIIIATNDGTSHWSFDTNGSLIFPDNTVQTTAYTGLSGIATYAQRSGIATYATSSGVSTIAGYATTAGISSVTQGLTGTPNISVGSITASNLNSSGIVTASSFRPSGGYYQSSNGTNSFYVYDGTGNVAFQGTIGVNQINSGSGYKALEFSSETTPVVMVTNGMNVSGVVTSTISIPTQLRTRSVAEKTTLISGNTVGLAFTTGGGNVAICTNPSGDITLNVTDIPTDSTFDNHSISFSVIVNQTGTARTCTTITLNGVSRTIKWAGGSLANAISGVTTSTGFDIFTFTGINTVGSASTTSNYVVLGSVNGGFN